MSDEPIRVLLVDDQALFREGVRTLLSVQEGIEVVGDAANGREAIRKCGELDPHVVLMDLRMPGMDGVTATREIVRRDSAIRVIVLTTFDDDEEVFAALRAGAGGYLLKDCPPQRLAEAIRAARRGESFLQPSVAARVVAELNRLRPSDASANRTLADPLSDRELEVLRELAGGRSNREIADRLHLAEGTVKNYVSSILSKLGVADRTRAALTAREIGLI
jgi:DNA-binding NarL/FixJ family response regulator